MSEQYIGEIRLFTTADVPAGWLLCDNASYSISEYQALFLMIGNAYGGNSHFGTFRVPDLRDHVPNYQGVAGTAAGSDHNAGSNASLFNFYIAYEGACKPR
ncbi:MAG: phage tail protein [Chloroflexota bacterium]